MAENYSTPTPMTDADIETPRNTQFQAAAPLKDAGVEFGAEGGTLNSGGTGTGPSVGSVADAKQTMRDGASNIGQQVVDKARELVDEGKTRAIGSLGQLVQMLNDAAETVDEKVGGHFGDYTRNAATQVQGFSDTVRDKDADALVNDARVYVRQSPGVAIGVAAVLGFALARLVQSGLDEHQA